MMLFRSCRRFAALAATFAILLQALWPLLSHARPGDPSLLVPVCTVEGTTHYLELKVGKQTPLDERSASHGEHCKLCVFGDGKSSAVVAPGSIFLLAEKYRGETTGSTESSFQSLFFRPAQPRAPPQFS